ncbi:MAG: hypothetical protein DRJ59_04085 [Thermoprotei archaeon]|nr:MAG: hypothetical protein DRJ59_04085 [Thermoprotei archaeon]
MFRKLAVQLFEYFVQKLRYFRKICTYLTGENVKNSSYNLGIKDMVLVVALVIALILSGFSVLACYSSASPYAVEVVLNKPGVVYDLSKLAGMESAASVDYFGAYSAYVYRSHYDDRLIVVVSEQGLKYANVKIPANEPVITFVIKGLDINPKQISDNIEKVRGELGWSVKTPSIPSGKGIVFVFTKTIGDAEVKVFLGIFELAEEEEGGKGYTVKLGLLVRKAEEISDELASKIKLEIERLLDKIELSQFKELLKINLVKGSLLRSPPEQEKYLAVRIQIPLKLEVTTTTVHTCSISGRFNISELRFETAENLGWSVWVKRDTEDNYVGFAMSKNLGYATLYVEGKGKDNELYLSLRVEGVSSLSDAILSEFKKVFKAVGLGEDLVGKCSFEKFEESRGRFVPAYDIGEEDIRKALRTELKWLSERGVISGLSEDDIEDIVSTAKLGYAGWNSRLVWSEGKWVPYSSTEGAMVLRCVRAPPSFFMLEEEVNEPAVESPGQASYDLFPTALYLTVSVVMALLAGAAAYLIARRSLPVEN